MESNDESIIVTRKNGLIFHMKPLVLWTAIVGFGSGNAIYTNLRLEPLLTPEEKEKLLNDVTELKRWNNNYDISAQASRLEMQREVFNLKQTCSLVRGDLEEIVRSQGNIIDRLDHIQQRLGHGR